jgi:ubiquinone biosynthesis protein COQ4
MTVWDQGLTEPLIRFLQDPADLSPTIEMYRIFSKDKSFQDAAAKQLMANKDFAHMYETWYAPPAPSFPELLALPKDSFGYLYAEHMKKNNLDPDYITAFEHKNILSYLWLRARQVHDIGHMLTGFDTSLLGEVGLKGFEIAQYGSPSGAANITAGLFALICQKPGDVNLFFDTFIKGYDIGKRWPLFMAIPWNEEWQTPLSTLKAKYQIN